MKSWSCSFVFMFSKTPPGSLFSIYMPIFLRIGIERPGQKHRVSPLGSVPCRCICRFDCAGSPGTCRCKPPAFYNFFFSRSFPSLGNWQYCTFHHRPRNFQISDTPEAVRGGQVVPLETVCKQRIRSFLRHGVPKCRLCAHTSPARARWSPILTSASLGCKLLLG